MLQIQFGFMIREVNTMRWSICAIIVLLAFWPLCLGAGVPPTMWEGTYGGSGNDEGRFGAYTLDGGFVLVGYTESFGNDGDVLLVKTDASGDTLWMRCYGGPNEDFGWCVQQTLPDSGYIIVGYTKSFGVGGDVYLIKTDSNGEEIWTKHYGGDGYDEGRYVEQTLDGGYIIAGRTESYGQGSDVYLIKTDADGNVIWEHNYGYDQFDIAEAVHQTVPDAGYMLVGSSQSGASRIYLIRLSSDGSILWQKRYGSTAHHDAGRDVVQVSTDAFVMTGTTQTYGGLEYDAFIWKVNAENGDSIWLRTYGNDFENSGQSIVMTLPDSGFVIAGFSYSQPDDNNSCDVFVMKTNSNGDSLWGATYGGPLYDKGYCIKQLPDGSLFVTGFNTTDSTKMDLYGVRICPCLEQPYLVLPDGSGDFPTVQDAITCAVDGDTILLADGTFTGDGNRDIDFLGKAITVKSLSDDPSTCVIDCHGSPTQAHRGFIFQSGELPTSVIQGISIHDGFVADPQMGGGAILCTNGSSPTLSKLVLYDNVSSANGAAIYCSASSPSMTGLTITQNMTEGAGAVAFVDGSHATIQSSILWGNTASAPNHGIFVDSASTVTVTCSDIQDGWEGSGNISADPLFCNAQNHDFHLHERSPCSPGGSPAGCGLMGALGIGCYNRAWYVATNGSDLTGDGSLGNPFATIQHALDQAVCGDTINVLPGRYEQHVYVANVEGLTIQAYPCPTDTGRAVVIADTSLSVFSFINAPGCALKGLEVKGGTYGISIQASGITINNCIINRNDNGLELIDASPVILNNVIADNMLYGVYLSQTSCPTMKNNIISGNWIGVYGVTDCCVEAAYNDVWGNTIDFGGACSEDWTGSGNLSEDPGFADAERADYHLAVCSPCIDWGDPDPSMSDPDGSRNDIGAYGGPYACQGSPSFVGDLRAYTESSLVYLSWAANAVTESVSYYLVLRDSVFPFDPDCAAQHYVDVPETTFVDTLAPGQSYAYRIAAVNANSYQGGYSAPILAQTAPMRRGILDMSYHWGCAGQTFIRGDVIAAGIGLSATGTGNISLSGIPSGARILKALLYWDGTPYLMLNGEYVGATKIGTDRGFSSYRAEVHHIVTGNGTYTVACDGYSHGASLVVVYEDTTQSLKAIMINDGLDNEGRGAGDGEFDITRFPFDQQDSVRACYIVGGGTPDLSEWYVYNGQVIGTDTADGSDGDAWDTDWIEIPSYAVSPPAGKVQCETYINELTDSLQWVVVVTVGLIAPAGVSNTNNESVWSLEVVNPNRSDGNVQLLFNIPRGGGQIHILVYDTAGRLVRGLVSGHLRKGKQSVIWDGTNEYGEKVSPGIYFVRMEAERATTTKKIVLLR